MAIIAAVEGIIGSIGSSQAAHNMDREELENARGYMKIATKSLTNMDTGIESYISNLQAPLGETTKSRFLQFQDIARNYAAIIEKHRRALKRHLSDYATFEDAYPFESIYLRGTVYAVNGIYGSVSILAMRIVRDIHSRGQHEPRLHRLLIYAQRLRREIRSALVLIEGQINEAFVAKMPDMSQDEQGHYSLALDKWTEAAIATQRGVKCSEEYSFWTNSAFQIFR
ncbi:MAG: hypothetical protein M1840_008649 [Geoglossum simile]|nr:MAG: hypothetical protein M1840_008649 [Geoglossum simile]